jgi:hypothetical protein
MVGEINTAVRCRAGLDRAYKTLQGKVLADFELG